MIEKTLQDLKGLIRVSSGEDPPSLVIQDAEILDIFSKTIFKGYISAYKSWIAYVGETKPRIGKETVVINGKGMVAVPGYIDGHGHSDLLYNPSAFADLAAPRGATTIFSDSMDMVDSIGVAGFIEVLKVSDGFAIKYLWSVPAVFPPYPELEGGEFHSFHDIWRLFTGYKECVSISELSAYRRILQNEDTVLDKILIARSLGKRVEGHLLGASYDKLNVLAAAGVTSCHESVRENDLRNRVRLGFYTMIRHSSIRSDLEDLAPVIRDLPKDSIMLVSDGFFARDLITKGYMDFVLKEAMRFGVAPVDAIRMCTLNPARYFNVDGEVGSIAPGRIADIVLLENIENPTPLKVIERGRVTAAEGRLIVRSVPFPDVGMKYYPFVFTTVEKDELYVPWKGSDRVPVIDLVDRTVTRRRDMKVQRDGNLLLPDRKKDIRKALYARRERKEWGRGLVKGIGADIGGIALTLAHETHGLLVLGFDDDDMVLAANTVLSLGGGVVLADQGKVLHALELPIGATMSRLTVPEIAQELTMADSIMRERGSALDDPVWTLTYLTITTIVELRLTVSGVYDVKTGEIVF